LFQLPRPRHHFLRYQKKTATAHKTSAAPENAHSAHIFLSFNNIPANPGILESLRMQGIAKEAIVTKEN
jgi:hypothetical protein